MRKVCFRHSEAIIIMHLLCIHKIWLRLSKNGVKFSLKAFYNTRMRKSNFEIFLDVVNFWSRCDSTVKLYCDTVQNKFVN